MRAPLGRADSSQEGVPGGSRWVGFPPRKTARVGVAACGSDSDPPTLALHEL